MPIRIESLVSDRAPLSPSQSVGEVFDWFLVHDDCDAMPVVFERTLVGMITRLVLLEQANRLETLSTSSQPIMPYLDTAPITVRLGQPLGEVAHQIASTGGKGFQQGVVVTRSGAYYGYVSGLSLVMALSAENTHRAKQMQRAAVKMKTMGQQLTELRQESGQALARLGHEVRTPLTAMLGHSERLLRQDMPAEARTSLDVLVRSSESLAELVSRSVEAGRASAGAVTPQNMPFSPNELGGELQALWTPEAEKKGLSLKVEVDRRLPARLEGDMIRIRQILDNLVSNAVKYTSNGIVQIILSGLEREEGHVAFSAEVTDSGTGISERDIEKLFKPFQRLSSTNGAEVQGSGLGLNISRNLARTLGGDIRYASGPEGGSRFTLSLPLRRAGPRLAVQGKPAPARKSRGTFQLGEILLIEDHAASQALIESTLQSAGWRVDTVSTLSQARRRIDHKPYQAILCDYFLRDGQGDVLIKMLRGHAGPNRDTLCLAVTADSSETRRRHCLAAGFAGVIVKPIRGPQLVTTLADFISVAGLPLADEELSLRA